MLLQNYRFAILNKQKKKNKMMKEKNRKRTRKKKQNKTNITSKQSGALILKNSMYQ